MISRKKILSCSQNDLSCDSGYEQSEEDVWYQKKTLYKVRDNDFNKNIRVQSSLFIGAFTHAVSACGKRSVLRFANTYLGLD
jgi:hypothetical protein